MRLIDADKLIKKLDDAIDTKNSIESIVIINALITLIEKQPTVTDTNVGSNWIPVSERLPNADEMSKCLYVNKYGYYITDAYISEVGGTYECENDYTILCDVIAWMPLPEPYKESDK